MLSREIKEAEYSGKTEYERLTCCRRVPAKLSFGINLGEEKCGPAEGNGGKAPGRIKPKEGPQEAWSKTLRDRRGMAEEAAEMG